MREQAVAKASSRITNEIFLLRFMEALHGVPATFGLK